MSLRHYQYNLLCTQSHALCVSVVRECCQIKEGAERKRESVCLHFRSCCCCRFHCILVSPRRSSPLSLPLLLSLSTSLSRYDNWPSRLSYSTPCSCSCCSLYTYTLYDIYSICIVIGGEEDAPTSVSAELSKRLVGVIHLIPLILTGSIF